MNLSRTRLSLAVALSLCALAALAQDNPIARNAAQPAAAPAAGVVLEGFFRPTPDGDPSLTKPRNVPQPASQSAQAAPRAFAATAATPAGLAMPARPADSNPASAATAVPAERWAEEQMDRVERESDRERQRALSAPPPVAPGAWDGTTSDRNR